MKTIFLCAVLCLAGCARFRCVQEEAPDGTKTTRVTVTTFFDAHSEIAKLRTTATDKTQGVSLGSVAETSASSNVVRLIITGAAIATDLAK